VAAGYSGCLATTYHSAEAFVFEIAGATDPPPVRRPGPDKGAATLSYRYLRDPLDNANDAVSVFKFHHNWNVVEPAGAESRRGTDTAYASTNSTSAPTSPTRRSVSE
jgi:hypothetical protein